MRGLFTIVKCLISGCRYSNGVCDRCNRMDVDRENLLRKTLQRNRMLEQENKHHAHQNRLLKQRLKSVTIKRK